MKIAQLISGIKLPLSNEESEFVDKHGKAVRINSLDEHAHWIAQNLVRKGIYSISKDNNTLVLETDENLH
jgi:hypothetical protein